MSPGGDVPPACPPALSGPGQALPMGQPVSLMGAGVPCLQQPSGKQDEGLQHRGHLSFANASCQNSLLGKHPALVGLTARKARCRVPDTGWPQGWPPDPA